MTSTSYPGQNILLTTPPDHACTVSNVTGRRTKLTPARQERILAALRTNVPIKVAAGAAGIGRSTLDHWREQGERARERLEVGEQITAYQRRCLGFLEAFEQVDAENHVFIAGTHQKQALEGSTKTVTVTKEAIRDGQVVTLTETRIEHIPPDQRAQEFILRSRWSETWNPATSVEVGGKGGGPVPVEVSMADLVAKLREIKGKPQAELGP
jgi:hypothetical protein